MDFSRSRQTKFGNLLHLVSAAVLAMLITGVAQAADWEVAFPESEQFGAFGPEYAAGAAANKIRDPKQLIEMWHRLPNDLHQWECGTESLGSPRRCLDMTFRGSGEYVGKAVLVHFDTINRLWHFMNFEIVKG